VSASLTIPTDGAGLGYSAGQTGSSETASWTNLTKAFDYNSVTFLKVSAATSTSAGSATRTASYSQFVSRALVLAAWSPPASFQAAWASGSNVILGGGNP
jgi:hypothetical protein